MFRRSIARLVPAIAVLGACLAGRALADAPRNLLANPGFEEAVEGNSWVPAGWDTSAIALPTIFFGRDTSVAHSGRYSVSVANVSTLLPLWHNWSQTLVVGPEMANKDVVFSVWTRSNGVQGRGYVLLQAYRDTISKMARTWKVKRDTAMAALGFHATTDPYLYLGSKREYFSDTETGWVRREVRVFVPPSTNLIIARCGLFGVGQVFFDDASLTVEEALPPPDLPVGVNLLADPGFEGTGDRWEYSLPPYDGMRCDRDTAVVHSGKASIRFSGGTVGMITTRAGVAQVISNRGLAGKRIRLSGWVKCDSLMGMAYPKLYCTTLDQDEDVGAPERLGNTRPWTKLSIEMFVPKGTYQVWAWLCYNAPCDGTVWFDDASLEILPSGTKPAGGAKSAKSRPAAAP